MSLRNFSNISFPSQGTPRFGGGQSRLGGGKGQAGSTSQQANPQSAMLQQLLPMLLARRASQTQQTQAPAYMSPAQRLAQMPQQAMPALTQAAPQPFFGTQSPGMQAQQAAAVAQAQQQAQPAAPAADPNAGKTPYDLTGFNQYMGNGQWIDNYGNPVSLAPNQIGYREPRTPTLPFLPR